MSDKQMAQNRALVDLLLRLAEEHGCDDPSGESCQTQRKRPDDLCDGCAFEMSAKALARCLKDAEPQWQPIETAPRDGTAIIGALFQQGRLCRVHDMKHNGLAFYTINGNALPRMTHWMPRPADPAGETEAPR